MNVSDKLNGCRVISSGPSGTTKNSAKINYLAKTTPIHRSENIQSSYFGNLINDVFSISAQ
jgi:hypothetical protein